LKEILNTFLINVSQKFSKFLLTRLGKDQEKIRNRLGKHLFGLRGFEKTLPSSPFELGKH
jgi:hypothetical protein